ncbi:acetylcholine receptor subunit alpha-like 2 [Liolophura sinensis]|uniref:acetylcholine receptor subunit alpha-like 2 n=1 Tax=Liolophura sinensis TaxID=3198878 RepID=UPI0031584151
MVHQLEWRDELLTWEPNQYGNITSIITSGFWKPDVVIYNGYNDFHDLRTSTVDGILQFDGSILWAPASTFETHCPVDITFYPFDKQTCSLHIMSWTYTAKDLDLVTTQQSVDTQNYITNVEWEIERTSAEQVVLIYDAYDGDYPTLFFNITLARRRIFFLMNVLIPAISESLLCNLVFLVPSESGERMSLAITVLLSYAVFLGVTMESLPRSSVNVSIMTLYMLVVLMLGTLSVLLTGFSLYIYHLPEPVRAFRRRHAVLENDPKENEVADLNKDQPNRNGYVNADPEIHRFVPEERVLYDAKEQSRQFDRICLKLILSLTIISVACLLIALTWHDY